MKIKPIQFPLGKTATKLTIRPLINSTEDKSCNTYYEIKTESGERLSEGNMPISEDEYEGWGKDNEYLEDIIITKLSNLGGTLIERDLE